MRKESEEEEEEVEEKKEEIKAGSQIPWEVCSVEKSAYLEEIVTLLRTDCQVHGSARTGPKPNEIPVAVVYTRVYYRLLKSAGYRKRRANCKTSLLDNTKRSTSTANLEGRKK